jgi:hypothetical protein
MTRYHYKINESDPQRITVRIYQGETQAATLTIIRENAADTPNFESVAVAVAFRQYGLSYALLHLALLYCKDKHETDCTVNNAHGTLIIALSQVGFVVLRQWRDPIAKQNQAMLTCDNLPRRCGSPRRNWATRASSRPVCATPALISSGRDARIEVHAGVVQW